MMKLFVFPALLATFDPVSAVTTTRQLNSPGKHIRGVLTVVDEQHKNALQEIKKLEQETEFIQSDCANSIDVLTKAVATSEAAVTDLSDKRDHVNSVCESGQASLMQKRDAKQVKTEKQQAAGTVAAEHQANLDADLQQATNSSQGIKTFLANAKGSHTENLQAIAQKLQDKLDAQISSLNEQLSNVVSSASTSAQSAGSDISDLEEDIERLKTLVQAAESERDVVLMNLDNEQTNLHSSQSALSSKQNDCKMIAETQANLMQDQTDLRDVFSTIKTMLASGSSESFMQKTIVAKDIRAVKLSLQALAAQYKNSALMHIVQEFDEPHWDIIFDGMSAVLDKLNKRIQTKRSEANSFVHDFSLKNEQAHDLCLTLDETRSHLDAATQASADAAEQAKLSDKQAADMTQTFQEEKKNAANTIRDNQNDVEEFRQNGASLDDLMELVHQRIAKKNLIETLVAKVQEARQDIMKSIQGLELSNEQLANDDTSRDREYQRQSQALNAKIADTAALSQSEDHIARQSGDKVRLLEKEQATTFGELQNFGELQAVCTDIKVSCEDAYQGCSASLELVQATDESRLQEMETELQGVKEAHEVLKGIVHK